MNRSHSNSRSPIKAGRPDPTRLSQAAVVSGPSPSIHIVDNDPLARARIATVQSGVASANPSFGGPRARPNGVDRERYQTVWPHGRL